MSQERRPRNAPDPLSVAEALRELVAFPTVSADTNLPLIDRVQGYLSAWGARCRRTENDEGTKANLLATFGPERPGGVILSGHTDVVPANEPTWRTDPFSLHGDGRDGGGTDEGTADRGGSMHEGGTPRGRWYGRGTADMKGFLAVLLAAAPELARTPLTRPVHLAFSYDEEVGCLGAPRMITDLLESVDPEPWLAIVGEPTGMRPVVGHKSVNVFRTRVEGKPAHSSQPHLGAGAILAAGRLVETLWRLGEEERSRPDGEWDFEPPWTTVQVGTIQGGTALNILPAECEFQWEYRALPDRDQDALREAFEREARTSVLPALREFAPDASIETREEARIPPFVPPGRADLDHADRAERFVGELLGLDTPSRRVVAFGTEAGLFQGAGIPTVVCGPGSIDQAHRPDEFVEHSQLRACRKFLGALVRRLEGASG